MLWPLPNKKKPNQRPRKMRQPRHKPVEKSDSHKAQIKGVAHVSCQSVDDCLDFANLAAVAEARPVMCVVQWGVGREVGRSVSVCYVAFINRPLKNRQ